MEYIKGRFEVKEIGGSGTFAGYGSVYNVVDQGDDVICNGCFGESLVQMGKKGAMPSMLWGHQSHELPIGAYTAVKEDATGLYVEGQLALKTQRGAECYELMQMKAVTGLSVGFMCRTDSMDSKTGIRTIKQADLFEISPVNFPMNDLARIANVKGIEEITDFKSAERFLRDACGLSRSDATAFFTRVKGLAQRDSVADDEEKQLIAALSRRSELLKV